MSWSVCGAKMTDAAATLSKVPSMKQAQLLIAARASKIAKGDRARVGKELKMLKQPQHQPDQSARCLWRYFAGFFDAEGSILVRSHCVGLQLEVRQVNPSMLVDLLHFLHDNQLRTWSLHDKTSSSALICTYLQDCKQTLELLLSNGLLVKRQQAELALSLTAANHLQIRDAISSLNGLQGRYQRLDADGIARAAEIRKLRGRLRHRASLGLECASMQCQLEELCSRHAMKNIIARCKLLRNDMRQALRKGGQVARALSS